MLDALLLIVSAILVLLVLMQDGKTDGVSGALTGGNKGLNLFTKTKARGMEKVLTILTAVLTAVFFILIGVLVL